MPDRPWVVVIIGVLTMGGTGGCSGPDRPTIRNDASRPASCEAAVAAAFPDGHQGTLAAYREVERRCASLAELARRKAFKASILRLDCAPADVLALSGCRTGSGRPRHPTGESCRRTGSGHGSSPQFGTAGRGS